MHTGCPRKRRSTQRTRPRTRKKRGKRHAHPPLRAESRPSLPGAGRRARTGGWRSRSSCTERLTGKRSPRKSALATTCSAFNVGKRYETPRACFLPLSGGGSQSLFCFILGAVCPWVFCILVVSYSGRFFFFSRSSLLQELQVLIFTIYQYLGVFLIPGTVALFLCGWCWCWLFPCGAFLALQHGTHGKRLEIKLMPADVYRWRALFWFGGASETRSCHASELFRSLRQDVRRGNW